ncbi:MAG: metal-dependent transcriptional regulator [Candidatus Krumholzibacteria bacterium]|nr:metal-dependent transcriptional regulator [Candidatus Krumholzibacteria bacterium]
MSENHRCILGKNRICIHDPTDEILEAIWVLDEKGQKTGYDEIIERDRRGVISRQLIDLVTSNGLLSEKDGIFSFTDTGRQRGEGVIRRHRLAERLLTDVLNVSDENEMETDACRFEHVLSPEVTDHICVLLGHPRTCPHGNAIPMGKCCLTSEMKVESAVVPLDSLKCGETGRILYMTTKKHERLDRLTSLGLFPGRHVRIHQREPLFVIFIGETQLALDKEIVGDIFVVRSDSGDTEYLTPGT